MTKARDESGNRASDIEQQAAEWVTRIDLRGSPEEWAALDAWLNISPRHRAAFLRLSAAWRRADCLKQLAPPDGVVDENLLEPSRLRARMQSEERLQPEEDAAHARVVSFDQHRHFAEEQRRRAPVQEDPHWAAARQLRNRGASGGSDHGASAERATEHPSARSSFSRLRFAASIVFILATTLATGTWFASRNAPDAQVFSTDIGEFRRVPLEDGSTVALNTDSEVRVRYTERQRHVELVRGEALFAVVKNAERPFDVKAGETTVRAVGTAFSVRLRQEPSEQAVHVVVSEGLIAINPPSKQTYAAGSVATVRKGGVVSATTVPLDAIEGRHAWTSGRLQFMNEKLSDVVAEMNRYNRRKLVITDPRIRSLRIGGAFDTTDLDNFVKSLKPLGIEVAQDSAEDGVIALESAKRQ